MSDPRRMAMANDHLPFDENGLLQTIVDGTASETGADFFRALGRAIVIAPPSADNPMWLRRFPRCSGAFASGWMRIRGNRRRRSVDRGFGLSDHADWEGLVDTIRHSGAAHIELTQGYAAEMARMPDWLFETCYDVVGDLAHFSGIKAAVIAHPDSYRWILATDTRDADSSRPDPFFLAYPLEGFGPVRSVRPAPVFEIAFEGIRTSTRHKSGVAVCVPRIARRRPDKTVGEADTIEMLHHLLRNEGARN